MEGGAINAEIIDGLRAITGSENVFINEPMRNHTSIRAGGNAAALVLPENAEQFGRLFGLLNGVRFYVMGNGTNLLVTDAGFGGVIIKTTKMSGVSIDGNVITAEAGALLSGVSRAAFEHSLSGLEFAEGIPGTVGGGVAMNAGAYGGEMKDVVQSVSAVDINGNICVVDRQSLEFGYRTSVIGRKGLVCLSAVFALEEGSQSEIKRKMDENKTARTEKQPLDKPSAGSTFKRPEGYFAGKLIADAGLRGYRIGGASVSEKHCGFVINDGNASASDIIKLIEHIRETVNEKFGVMLQPEVKIIGD